jgi:hypothetical protein
MNKIGPEGAKYLSNSQWLNLTKLNLSIISKYVGWNNIITEGAKHISKANWPKLTDLNLCILSNH